MNSTYRFSILFGLAALAIFGFVRLGQSTAANSIKEASYQPKQVEAKDITPKAGPGFGVLVKVPILMYHHVGDTPSNADGTRRDLTVSSSGFTDQVKWLADHHYHSVSLAQVHLAALGQFQLPEKPVAFTFDDGYEDAVVGASKILKDNGFTGSFGIITQFIGTPDYATWDQVRAAQAEGMEIVSHTQNHFDGSSRKFNYDYIKANLSGSRDDIARELGTQTDIIIYPYGHFTADYIRAANDVGFHMGLTTAFGKSFSKEQLMVVPRVRVHGGVTLSRFVEILLGTTKIPQSAITAESLE